MKKWIVSVMVLFAAFGVQAERIASYNDGTDADADALINLASAASVTVTDLSPVGFEIASGLDITRTGYDATSPAGPTAGSSIGSEWLFARASKILSGAPRTTTDYFGFTVTADSGKMLDLTNIKFDLVSTANASPAYAEIYTAQVFYSVDGGAFASIGSSVSSTAPSVSDVWSSITTANIDLSTITGASSVEIRIGLGDAGTSDTNGAAFVQGRQMDATFGCRL